MFLVIRKYRPGRNNLRVGLSIVGMINSTIKTTIFSFSLLLNIPSQ